MARFTNPELNTPEFLFQVFQGIPEAVAIVDPEDRIVVVNEQFERFFRYKQDAIHGHAINDLVVPEEYRDEGVQHSRQVLGGTPLYTAGAVRCRADGTRVSVSISARPIYLEGRQANIVVIYRDISDQEILLDSTDTHIWYLQDPNTYGAVNEAHARFIGRSKEEMRHRRMEEIYPPDDAARLRTGNEAVFANAKPVTIERWSRRCDGEMRLLRITKNPRFDAPGHIRYLVCSAEDITEERQRENQLRLLSSMVEQSADPMVRTDAEYRITYLNPAAEKHYGWTLEEIRGKDPAIFNAEENADHIQDEIRSTIMAGRTYEGRVRNHRKDGSIYIAQLRISPIFDAAGEIIGFVDIQRDITADQKELETKELLLREVRHRVKNNLATVVSLLSLQAGSLADDAAVAALGDASRRVEAMLSVYEALQVSSSEGTIDLRTYLENLVERLKSTLDSRYPIHYRHDRLERLIGADEAVSVGMIVNELLTNAIKHAFPADRDGTVSVELARVDDTYRIVVEDTGGYPAASAQQVESERLTDGCEPGAAAGTIEDHSPHTVGRQEETGRHTGEIKGHHDESRHHDETGHRTDDTWSYNIGLGLTLVNSLVERLNGAITTERTDGTRVTLTIPAPREGPPEHEAPPALE